MIEEHACLLTFFTARVLGAWTDTTNFNATKQKFRQMQGIFKRQMHYIQFSALFSTDQKSISTPPTPNNHATKFVPLEQQLTQEAHVLTSCTPGVRMPWILLLHDSKHSLGSWQLYSHPSEARIPTTEEYPQLMEGFYSQEGQHRPGA